MRFSSILSLAMPAVVLAQNTTTFSTSTTATTSSAAASSTAGLEAICEAQASSYASSCPQCLHTCAGSSAPDQCYFAVFTEVNYIQSMCEAQGGSNCRNIAINDVCGTS